MQQPTAARQTGRISAIVLAAGASTRMPDSNKLLLPLAGEPIVRTTCKNILESKVAELVVVLGVDANLVRRALHGLDVRCVFNPAFADGMSTSVAAGLQGVSAAAAGAIIFLADQPNLRTETIDRFCAKFEADSRTVVAARCGTVVGNPALFPRKYFHEISQLTGDSGPRRLLQKYSGAVCEIVVPEAEGRDIDTPADLQAMRRLLHKRKDEPLSGCA